MSFWDRLGTTAKAAYNSTLFQGATAPVKFAWDMASGLWRDEEEYNGFVNTFKTSGLSLVQKELNLVNSAFNLPIVKPVVDRIVETNDKWINKPLTAFALLDSDFDSTWVKEDGTRRSLSEAWAKAREEAKTTSFGQAMYAGIMSDFGSEEDKQRFAEMDYTNKAYVDNYFSMGNQKYISGIFDFGMQVFGDVTIVGGKAVKAAKGASWATNQLNSATKVQRVIDGVKVAQGVMDTTGKIITPVQEETKFTKLLDQFVQKDSIAIREMPEMKNAPDSVLWALGKVSDDVDELGNVIAGSGRYKAGVIYRAGALGDTTAIEELRKIRPDLANPIAREQGELLAYDQWKLANRTKEDGMLEMPFENEALMLEIDAEMKSLAANQKEFSNFWAVEQIAASGIRTVDRSASGLLGGVDRFIGDARNLRFYDRKSSVGNTDIFQPTPFHRMYQKISWAAHERPAGVINFHDPDSSREVTAVLDRAVARGAATSDEARKMLESYIGAATPEQRAFQVRNIEERIFTKIAVMNDHSAVSAKKALENAEARGLKGAELQPFKDALNEAEDAAFKRGMDIYSGYNRARESAMNTLKAKGFIVDEENNVIRHSVFESTSANELPMMDFDLAANVLRRDYLIRSKNPALQALGVTEASAQKFVSGLDITMQLFKIGALLRLGYPIRNGLEAQLRIASTVGSMASMRWLPGGMKNLTTNSGRATMRFVDRMKGLYDESLTYEGQLKQLQETGGALAKTRAQIAELEKTPGSTYAPTTREEAFQDVLEANPNIYRDYDTALVRVDFLKQFMEYDRAGKGAHAGGVSEETISAIQKDLESGVGFKDAGILDYHPESGGMVLIEGNHRLAAAIRAGVEYMPVRVVTSKYPNDKMVTGVFEGKIKPDKYGYFVGNANPIHLLPEDVIKPVKDPQSIADIEALRNMEAEQQSFYDKINSTIGKMEKRSKKARMATGSFIVDGLDGRRYVFDDSFAGPFADIHWNNSSASESQLNLVDRQAGLLAGKLVKGGYEAVTPDKPNYYTEWAHAINYQFGNAEVAVRLARGESVEQVATWLRTSTDGRNLRGRLTLKASESDGYVLNTKSFLDKYVPDVDLQARLANREIISPEDLRAKFTDPKQLPTIHGHILEENLNLVGERKAAKIVQGLFHMIGTLPEDAWARHPVYTDLYRASLRKRVDEFEKIQGRALDTSVDVVRQADGRITTREMADMMKQAHIDALRGTKKILFTVDRKTNLASMLRFVSPFFSAYENSGKTWARLVAEKPQLINRANLIFTAPNRLGMAYDENGDPVPADQASMDDYIVFQIPKGLKQVPGLKSFGTVGIQKRSLDVIFQGGFDLPLGPLATVPISELVKDKPTLEDSVKWALPYGPERNYAMALLPAWLKKQLIKSDGQDNIQYANVYNLIWQTEQFRRKDQGLSPATPDEIKEMTNSYWNMRTVANLVLPFAPTFNSEYKFYIDQYRKMREEDYRTADEKFWKTFGDDAFIFTSSLSKNVSGSGATVTDVENAKKYKGLIADIAAMDPGDGSVKKMIGLVTAAGRGPYEFSQAAYQWQQEATLSEGGSDTFRTTKDPEQASIDNQVSLGWIKFNNVMSQIDAVMEQRGLKNLQQKGAGDLAQYKKQLVEQLKQENKQWYYDYMDSDGSKSLKTKEVFKTILHNEDFMKEHGNDPTWKSIWVYMNFRDEVDKVLASRAKIKGGSPNLTADTNADLAWYLETAANQLKHQDIGFADIYNRYFSYDTGYDSVITGVAQ